MRQGAFLAAANKMATTTTEVARVDGPATEDTAPIVVSSSTNEKPIRSIYTAWLYMLHWYPSPSHCSKEEKHLLMRLDWFLLPFVSLMCK